MRKTRESIVIARDVSHVMLRRERASVIQRWGFPYRTCSWWRRLEEQEKVRTMSLFFSLFFFFASSAQLSRLRKNDRAAVDTRGATRNVHACLDPSRQMGLVRSRRPKHRERDARWTNPRRRRPLISRLIHQTPTGSPHLSAVSGSRESG